MRITVLICTYNRGNLIGHTLHSLIEDQDLTPDEIIVVNGGGENDCSSTVAYWQSKFTNLKQITTKNQNLAASRNIGLSHCTGTIVLQTDDDASPFPDWVRKMKRAHEMNANAGVIGGEVVDASGKGLINAVADALTFPWYPGLREVRTVPGVNSSYKKELLDQVGKYDTSLSRGEDVDFNWRALQSGWKVLYVPEIKVCHQHRASWRGLFQQQYMYGKAYFLVRSKWPDMYSVYPRSLKTGKDFLKAVYFIFSPVHNSFVRLTRIKGFFRKLIAFFPMMGIGYSWMAGLLAQSFHKEKSSPNLEMENIPSK